MTKPTIKSKYVWLRLTPDEYEQLRPKDGRSVGNEVRRRLFGDVSDIDQTESIAFYLTDNEYYTFCSWIPEKASLGGEARRLILERMDNIDIPFCEAKRGVGSRKHPISVKFTPEESEKFREFVKESGESISAVARRLIFGRR